MATTDDFKRIAHLAGLSVSPEEVERLAPALETLYADLDRLRALPIADLEPAFTSRLDPAVP